MDASRRSFFRIFGLGAVAVMLEPFSIWAALGQRFPIAPRRLEIFTTNPSPGNISVVQLSLNSGIGLDIRHHPSGIGNFVYGVNGHVIDPDQGQNQANQDGWMFGISQVGGGWNWHQGRAADQMVVPRGCRVYWRPKSSL